MITVSLFSHHAREILKLARYGVGLAVLAFASIAIAQPNPSDDPPKFVQDVADEILVVLKSDPLVKQQDMTRINEIVDQYLMPYVDFERTTRLAVGRHWRQASETQRQELVEAFKNTLIRTYSGALNNIDSGTTMQVLPYRQADASDDVVVRSNVVQATNMAPIRVDYRLRLGDQGWRIYDINVENIWLIQNYRNQFSEEINRSGIDGLIVALNERNATN
jgi:phospholipid transport system substrate-binding protein